MPDTLLVPLVLPLHPTPPTAPSPLSLGPEVLLQPEAVQAHKLLHRFRAVIQTRQVRLALVGHSLRGVQGPGRGVR